MTNPKSKLLFSSFLTPEQVNSVKYYSYFPVIEEKSGVCNYARLLPSDNAIAYPIVYDTITKEITKGTKSWYNEKLVDFADPLKLLPAEKVTRMDFSQKKHSKCIVFNLLDYCYGHSFLKLLNSESFYEDYSDSHDLFLISFPDIEDYIPKGKFNGCSLNLTFSEINKIYNLEPILTAIRSHYDEVDFPVLDAYLKVENKRKTTDFFNFYGTLENSFKDKNIVTLYYRKERGRKLWGDNEASQGALFLATLRKYFSHDVLFCVLGDKDENNFPSWIMDKRTVKYPNPLVYEYSQILSSSVLVVGVIGSNLVLPSLLSPGMVVHIVKEDFTRLTSTDVINYNGYAVNTAFEQVYLFEDIQKKGYNAEELAIKILRLFAGKLFIDYRNKSFDLLRNSTEVLSQTEYILKVHSYCHYDKIMELDTQINEKVYKQLRRQSIINMLKSNPLELIKIFLSKGR